MSHRKPKRNARRAARTVKRDPMKGVVAELPPVRITDAGREFVRHEAGNDVAKLAALPTSAAYARSVLQAHAKFIAAELQEVVRTLNKIESDPDSVSLQLYREVAGPIRTIAQASLAELMEDIQLLAKALRRGPTPPEAA